MILRRLRHAAKFYPCDSRRTRQHHHVVPNLTGNAGSRRSLLSTCLKTTNENRSAARPFCRQAVFLGFVPTAERPLIAATGSTTSARRNAARQSVDDQNLWLCRRREDLTFCEEKRQNKDLAESVGGPVRKMTRARKLEKRVERETFRRRRPPPSSCIILFFISVPLFFFLFRVSIRIQLYARAFIHFIFLFCLFFLLFLGSSSFALYTRTCRNTNLVLIFRRGLVFYMLSTGKCE